MATAVSARVFKNLINGEWVAPKTGSDKPGELWWLFNLVRRQVSIAVKARG